MYEEVLLYKKEAIEVANAWNVGRVTPEVGRVIPEPHQIIYRRGKAEVTDCFLAGARPKNTQWSAKRRESDAARRRRQRERPDTVVSLKTN